MIMRLFELDAFTVQQRQLTTLYFDVKMDAESAGYPWPPSMREIIDRGVAAMQQISEAMGAALLPAIENMTRIMGRYAVEHRALIEDTLMRCRWGRLYPVARWIKTQWTNIK